jgi:hypothetical protein
MGTESMTAACPVTGMIHHIEIQHRKEGMKQAKFNDKLGLRLLLNTIPLEEQGTKHGVRGDARFGSVKSANEVGICGHECVFQVKQYHSLFPKEFIEETLNKAPGGMHIVLQGTTKDEVNLVARGYKYSHKIILHFVLTKNAGERNRGDPYEMKYTDNYGNIPLILLTILK